MEHDNTSSRFLLSEVEEVIEQPTTIESTEVPQIKTAIRNTNTNKSNVVKAIRDIKNHAYTEDLEKDEYKDIKRIGTLISKRTKEDTQSIQYLYSKLLNLFLFSGQQSQNSIYNMLKRVVNEILKTDLYDKNSYEMQNILQWKKSGLF